MAAEPLESVMRRAASEGPSKTEKEIMRKRRHVKLVREGRFVAEVDVNLIESESNWAPFLSLEDAYKLDDVREALRRDDVAAAARLSRVYTLKPLAV